MFTSAPAMRSPISYSNAKPKHVAKGEKGKFRIVTTSDIKKIIGKGFNKLDQPLLEAKNK